jgi:sialate O-acetylesterase
MKKIIFSLSLLLSFAVSAQVRLPAIIGDHMVLQQNTNVKIWGWCDVGEKITLKASWDTTSYKATGSPDAAWSIELKTPSASGPYTIDINGKNAIVLNDVLIGEVWLCGGQSNMEMSAGWGLKQYDADVAAATNKSIRFFHVPRTTAEFPQDNLPAKWVVCNPEDMKRFSLAGYFFGQKINSQLGVPVGLINSSWGGTPAEVWTPKNAIEEDAVLKQAAGQLKKVPWGPVLPAYAYNAMIYPFINFPIAGAIWYQGEANVDAADTYQKLFSAMITSWRKAWGKEFPFYFVQIAPFAGYGKDNIKSALLREAQTETLSVPNTGMIVTSDLVDNINDIHPQMKKEVGLRLANFALSQTYGKSGLAFKSPSYQSMKLEKDKIRIHFKNAEKGLAAKGGALTEFYISGEDKNFVPATATIEGNTVIVWNKNVKKPIAVRFGFTNAAMPNLFSKEGLPVNLFRTDDWNVPTSGTDK